MNFTEGATERTWVSERGNRHGDCVEISDNANIGQVIHIDTIIIRCEGSLIIDSKTKDKWKGRLSQFLKEYF